MALRPLVFMAVAQILIVAFPGKRKLGAYGKVSESSTQDGLRAALPRLPC